MLVDMTKIHVIGHRGDLGALRAIYCAPIVLVLLLLIVFLLSGALNILESGDATGELQPPRQPVDKGPEADALDRAAHAHAAAVRY